MEIQSSNGNLQLDWDELAQLDDLISVEGNGQVGLQVFTKFSIAAERLDLANTMLLSIY